MPTAELRDRVQLLFSGVGGMAQSKRSLLRVCQWGSQSADLANTYSGQVCSGEGFVVVGSCRVIYHNLQ